MAPAIGESGPQLVLSLVGNPEVGKSTLFNSITGLNYWTGKTFETKEGILSYKGRRFKVIDLPGVYSLSSYSYEELITRNFILSGESDAIINVVDASSLERNLYLTIQLLEMGAPVIVALNFVEVAQRKGIKIDSDELSRSLGVPVVEINAITGRGIDDLIERFASSLPSKSKRIAYGKEVESAICELRDEIIGRRIALPPKYEPEWVAIKLLEGDEEIAKKIDGLPLMEEKVVSLRSEIERIHGESASTVISSERYFASNKSVLRSTSPIKVPVSRAQRLDELLTHRIFGYLFLVLIMGVMFTAIFAFGGYLSALIDGGFEIASQMVAAALEMIDPLLSALIVNGLLFGIGAALSIALPYIATFYMAISILEDSGYLPRAAYLLDSLMHKIGLHGKAFIPMILGYGCSVPACIGCRLMETRKERLILGSLVVLIPCSARTVIILGVAGQYLGILAALAIYALDIVIVLGIGRILFKSIPGESVGLIMEIPKLRRISPKIVLKRTWFNTKDFVSFCLPLIVVGSIIIELARFLGLIEGALYAMSPVTVGILGLPVAAGIAMIFGLLRKELALIMLATYVGTTDFSLIMTPLQMAVFTIVMVLYVPCIATIGVLMREYGNKNAAYIIALDLAIALAVGALARLALIAVGF
uniref:Ferrous iron transport protein B n=1 Tax=Candidatus Methanomethylicus mesodigestus TaxID=1867258 RepID=A0A7C3N8T0_9CREN